MSATRRELGISVLEAAEDRISRTFDQAKRVYVSFSGGKDSTVMLDLVAREARRRGRRIGVLFVDLEAQYQLTVDHVANCYAEYADVVDPYWVTLPLNLRNAVSQYEPFWTCWDADKEASWVRKMPKGSIRDAIHWSWFRPRMEFEEFVPEFANWYAGDEETACFVGIRTQESLNRWRTIASQVKQRVNHWPWSTRIGPHVWNCYPIYDWRTEDIWTYHAVRPEAPVNGVYDLMYRAGLTIHQARICQPYGDDQRKGLWLFQVLEPQTWARVVARVNGANQGALYAQENGNILGNLKITRPEGHSWESFSKMIIESMPAQTAEHYQTKIEVFLAFWRHNGYPNGIPDQADPKLEARRKAPSWRRIAKCLLKNDYWCKSLSFSPTKTASLSYARYKSIMFNRERWAEECEVGKYHPAGKYLTAQQMNVPEPEQLALIVSLIGGRTPQDAYRAIERITNKKRREQRWEDASATIDALKAMPIDLREGEFGYA